MNETYFVSFISGSSGRFVCSILWNLINDLDLELSFGKYNSAHLEAYWSLSWDLSETKGPFGMIHNIYEKFNFNLTNKPSFLNPYNKGLLNVHVYPKFDIIEKRFPDTRIIIVQVDDDDLESIAKNSIRKNAFEIMESTNDKPKVSPFNQDALFAKTLYFEKYNKHYDVGEDGLLSEEDKNYIVKNYVDMSVRLNKKTKSSFINPTVPESFKNKTLILPYKDIFKKENDTFVGLSLLEKFTNTKATVNTIKTYEKYVKGNTYEN